MTDAERAAYERGRKEGQRIARLALRAHCVPTTGDPIATNRKAPNAAPR